MAAPDVDGLPVAPGVAAPDALLAVPDVVALPVVQGVAALLVALGVVSEQLPGARLRAARRRDPAVLQAALQGVQQR
ncbi:MAG: hypothetical protein ACREML_09055 [Vulcanimicrobiaceae bacterium]